VGSTAGAQQGSLLEKEWGPRDIRQQDEKGGKEGGGLRALGSRDANDSKQALGAKEGEGKDSGTEESSRKT